MRVCSIRLFAVVSFLSFFMLSKSLQHFRFPNVAKSATERFSVSPTTHIGATMLGHNRESIDTAAKHITKGGLVAFPTETVYGLGANALMKHSVQAIFTAKARPNSDPLIVHIADLSMMDALFDFSHAPEGSVAKQVCAVLAKKFWPGPLTIVYKASKQVPSIVCAGTGYVGVRCPSHPIALSLLKASGVPLAAPSANRFGHVSPTCAAHAQDDLGHCDSLILADRPEITGGCRVGVESTVCKVSDDGRLVSILRCGAVTSDMIRKALQHEKIECTVVTDNERHLHKTEPARSADTSTAATTVVEAAVAPGQMLKHYAPDLPTFIVRKGTDVHSPQAHQHDSVIYDPTCAMVVDFGGQLAHLRPRCKHYVDLSSRGSAAQACNRLFNTLRSAESEKMRALGVTHVLLPDLRDLAAHIPSANVNIATGGASESGGVNVSAQGAPVVTSGKDELLSALWERLHRAASGTFIWQIELCVYFLCINVHVTLVSKGSVRVQAKMNY